MSREEFLEWAQSDSLGEYFNDEYGSPMSVAINTFTLVAKGIYVTHIYDATSNVACNKLCAHRSRATSSLWLRAGSRGYSCWLSEAAGRPKYCFTIFLAASVAAGQTTIRASYCAEANASSQIFSVVGPAGQIIWPKCQFNRLKNIFEWPTGESLELSYYDTEADWPLYQGKAYAWIGWRN